MKTKLLKSTIIMFFLLLSTQASLSQPVSFDFMFGWGVDDGTTNAFQICTSATTPCFAGIFGSGAGQFTSIIPSIGFWIKNS